MPEQVLSIRDIPNLDDRLVRFLEQLTANVNELLSLHHQNRDAIDTNKSEVPNIVQIRAELEATGLTPINVENIRGLLAQSQKANIPRLTALPALSDGAYIDGDAISFGNDIYIRNRSTEPGSWDLQ